MKLIGPTSAFAPMPTGHPLGLPGQMSVKDAQTRVVEPAKSSATNLATHLGMPMRKPPSGEQDAADTKATLQPRSSADPASAISDGGEPKAAPPTILQLKINAILQEQADKLADQIDEAAAAPGVTAQTTPARQVAPAQDPAVPTQPVEEKSAASEQAAVLTEPAADTTSPTAAAQTPDPAQAPDDPTRPPEPTAPEASPAQDPARAPQLA